MGRKTKYSLLRKFLNDLCLEPCDWRNYWRIDEDTYIELLNLITPLILIKKKTRKSNEKDRHSTRETINKIL